MSGFRLSFISNVNCTISYCSKVKIITERVHVKYIFKMKTNVQKLLQCAVKLN